MSSTSASGNVALSSVLLGLSTIAVGGRFFARKQQKVVVGVDDIFALAAWVAYVGAVACHIYLIEKKILGFTLTTASDASEKTSSLFQISWDIAANFALACIKLSAIFFYRRVFCIDRSRNWFNTATIVIAVIIVCWLIGYEFLAGFQCGTHFSALWGPTYAIYCTHSTQYVKSVAISNLILDFIVLLLPIPRIWQLNTTPSRKLGIIAVFLTAFVSLGASIARMVIFIQASNGGAAYYASHDTEHIETNMVFFAMLELGMSMLAVNLPTLVFLVRSVSPDKVVRSIRSMISLRSIRSNRSDIGDGATGNNTKEVSPPHTGRQSDSSGPKSTRDETFRADLEAYKREVTAVRTPEETVLNAPPNGVHVQSTTSVEHNVDRS